MNADLFLLQIGAGWFFGSYFGLFLHELGHALMGWRMGYDVTSFGMGLASPLLVLDVRGTRLYFCRKHFDRGLTFALFRHGQPTRTQQIGFLAGGMLANLLLALAGLGFGFAFDSSRTFWMTTSVVNIFMASMSLVPGLPWTHLPQGTDGSLILQAIRGRSGYLNVIEFFECFHLYRPLLQAVGDRRMEAHYLEAAASRWALLGDEERAAELRHEGEELGQLPSSASAATEMVRQAKADQCAGRLEAAAEAFGKARQLFALEGDPSGELATIYYQAALAGEQCRTDDAETFLTDAESHPLVTAAPSLKALARLGRLEVQGKQISTEQLDGFQVDYEAARNHESLPEYDWLVYRKLARLYIEREEWARAEVPAALACKAALTIWKALPKPKDRQGFASLAAQFQNQTCDLLKRLGREDEASIVASLFQEEGIDLAALQAEQVRRQRERQRYRLGFLLTAVNIVVCGVALWGLTILNRTTPQHFWNSTLFAGLMLLFFVLIPVVIGAILYQVLYFLIRSQKPKNQESPGTMTLALAAIPWIVFVVLAPLLVVLRQFWWR